MLDCSKETPGMRWYPEPDEGTLRPSRRKARVSGEGRTRSPWQPFTCTPGAGIVHHPRVTAPPRRNSFHHLAPVFPQELKTSTCWDVPEASRGEGKTRAGVEPPAPLPPRCFTGHSTHEGSSSPCWLVVLLEEGALRGCSPEPTLDPARAAPVSSPPRCRRPPAMRYHPGDGAPTWCARRMGSSAFGKKGSLCTAPKLQLGLGLELRVLLSHVKVPARPSAAGTMGGETFSADANTVYV